MSDQPTERERKRRERVDERHATKRELIIDAAIDELRDAARFTIQGTANRSHVSKPAVYYYFEDERSLILAIAKRFVTMRNKVIAGLVAGIGIRPSEYPGAILATIVDFYTGDPVRAKVLHCLVTAHGQDLALRLSYEGEEAKSFRTQLEARNPLVSAAFDLALGIVESCSGTEASKRVATYTRWLKEKGN